MGLSNRTGGKYITILNGKFCMRVDEKTVGATSRVNKVGKTVHELFYDSFTGRLVDIKTQDGSAYGKTWIFDFQDKEDVYHLQLSYSNSYATAFLKMLPNIDLTKEMQVTPSLKEVDGRNQSSLFVNQDGKPVKHAYTKDNPNGLPPMEEITVKGQKIWDDTKRLEFLYNMVANQIMPKLGSVAVNVAHAEVVPVPIEAAPTQDIDSFVSDLQNGAKTEDDPF